MEKKKYRLSFYELLFFAIIIIIVFSEFLAESVSKYFLYFDDLLLVIIIVSGLLNIIKTKKKLNTIEKRILFLLILTAIIGFIGNFHSNFQSSTFAILIDFLGWQKFFMVYIFLQYIISDEQKEKYTFILTKYSKTLIVLSLFLAFLNLTKIINLTPGYERFDLYTFSLGGHPSSASAIFATIICLLLSDLKKNKTWIFLAMIIEVLTFRFKAIAFVLLALFCMIFMKKRINIKKMVIAVLCVVVAAWPQISYYFLRSTSSRAVALSTSIQIANDFFPFGSGYATYGTSMSGKYYSYAYVKYGLMNKWGFSPTHYEFIGDGGFANIIGQFGYIGTLLFLIVLLLFIKNIQMICEKNSIDILPFICLIGYLIISTSNEGGLNSAYAILMAFVCTVLLKKGETI